MKENIAIEKKKTIKEIKKMGKRKRKKILIEEKRRQKDKEN